MAQPGQTSVSRGRVSVRIALLCLIPLAGLLGGLHGYQVVFCASSAILWSLLEFSLSRKKKLCAACKKVPFVFRLFGSLLVDVQACWILTLDASLDMLASPNATPGDVVTLSVVLPCANETDYVLKTVKSVFEFTPSQELKEIIVIDDASQPVISQLISQSELEANRARIIRHDIAQGLIRSKKVGGDAATGDAIIFLDCHVRPVEGWTHGILRRLRQNVKRVVVPSITTLDIDSWQEVSPYGGGKKMCLTWNADFFWCNEYPGPYVPIMSGGLLGVSRYWWEAIGGYDEEMHAWGGENLDMSLRTWLCGGEIVVADESRVAHMWRDPGNPRTQLKYSIPTNDVRRNRLRAVEAWLGEFSKKVRTFPEFEAFAEGGPLRVGNLDNVVNYRSKLKCKGFDWYLHRFQDFYFEVGMLPATVFNLREKKSGLCLNTDMSTNKALTLVPCSKDSETQRFHESNARPDRRGGCCSGIKLWDFDGCLNGNSVDQPPTAEPCNLFGRFSSQHFDLASDGLLKYNRGQGCVVPKGDASNVAGDGSGPLVFATCGAKSGQRYSRQKEKADGTFQLKSLDSDVCLGHDNWNGLTVVKTVACTEADKWRHDPGGQLRNVHLGLCLDANDMQTPIIYPCYPPGSNPKQSFVVGGDSGWISFPRSWGDNGRQRFPAKCLDSKPANPTTTNLASCEQARQDGHTWERAWSEVPMETKIFQRVASKGAFLWKSPLAPPQHHE